MSLQQRTAPECGRKTSLVKCKQHTHNKQPKHHNKYNIFGHYRPVQQTTTLPFTAVHEMDNSLFRAWTDGRLDQMVLELKNTILSIQWNIIFSPTGTQLISSVGLAPYFLHLCSCPSPSVLQVETCPPQIPPFLQQTPHRNTSPERGELRAAPPCLLCPKSLFLKDVSPPAPNKKNWFIFLPDLISHS